MWLVVFYLVFDFKKNLFFRVLIRQLYMQIINFILQGEGKSHVLRNAII